MRVAGELLISSLFRVVTIRELSASISSFVLLHWIFYLVF